jgi:hypothetical protein
MSGRKDRESSSGKVINERAGWREGWLFNPG